jgi:hypothetical protein
MRSKYIYLIILIMLLTACGSDQTVTPDPALVETLMAEHLEQAVEPTSTPLPEANPLLALYAAPGTEAGLAAGAQSAVEESAAQLGLLFEVRNVIDLAAPAPEGLQVLVALPPAPGLAEAVAAWPEVQFIALAVPGLTPAPNLTEITAGGEKALNEGFLAGYIAAAHSDDYRVGTITSFAETGYREGFVNGVRYFCGLCQQQYPPFYNYPIFIEIQAPPNPAEWQAAADQLAASNVLTVYIAPDISDPALIEYLAQSGIQVIGGVTPPESASGSWLLAVRHGLLDVLRQTLPLVLQGGSQGQLRAYLSFEEVNPALVGEGRITHYQRLAAEVEAGIIDAGNP